MKKLPLFICTALLAVIVISCEKEEKDTTKPSIELDEPADGDTLYVGHEMHLEMDLSDDVMLKSYKVDIHNNFDGHSHAKSALTDGAWTYTNQWDVSGSRNSHIHHHEIFIPTSVGGFPIARGKYHFMIYCTDAAGNESYAVRSVVVEDGVPHEEE